MKAILRLASIPSSTEEVSEEAIARFISQCFNESCDDSEAHVVTDAMTGDAFFIFGSKSPEALCEEVKGWNADIRNGAKRLMQELLDQEVMPMDTLRTYTARKAVEELDNVWSEESQHLVLLPDATDGISCETIIPDCYLEDIQRAPEDYVIVNVYVKN